MLLLFDPLKLTIEQFSDNCETFVIWSVAALLWLRGSTAAHGSEGLSSVMMYSKTKKHKMQIRSLAYAQRPCLKARIQSI